MNAIDVECPARLHLGFIDPSARSGRRFGSLGLALDGMGTRLRLSRARSAREAYRVASPAAQPELLRIDRYLERLSDTLGWSAPLAVELLEAIPPHAGLGSGTQLALALGYGLSRLAGTPLGSREVALLTGRGARSGIGIGLFEQGGFVVDGGRSPRTDIPPLLARQPFPAAWRVILIFDPDFTGMHGEAEREAFRRLPELSAEHSGQLAQLALMNVLPGLAEADFPLFGTAVTRIQAIVGDYFAPAQGGRYASRRVARWLDWFAAQGAVCYGQSSWGPTGFVIVPGADEARRLLEAAKRTRAADDPVRFRSLSGRNTGARIVESHDASPATLS